MHQILPIPIGHVMRRSLNGAVPSDELPGGPAEPRPREVFPGVRDSLALTLHGVARWR